MFRLPASAHARSRGARLRDKYPLAQRPRAVAPSRRASRALPHLCRTVPSPRASTTPNASLHGEPSISSSRASPWRDRATAVRRTSSRSGATMRTMRSSATERMVARSRPRHAARARTRRQRLPQGVSASRLGCTKFCCPQSTRDTSQVRSISTLSANRCRSASYMALDVSLSSSMAADKVMTPRPDKKET